MEFDTLADILKLEKGTRIERYDDLRDFAEPNVNLGKTSKSEVRGLIKFIRSKGIEVGTHLERDLTWLASDKYGSYNELFFILDITGHSHVECNTEVIKRVEKFWDRPVRFVDALVYIWILTEKRIRRSFWTKFSQDFARTARKDRMRDSTTIKIMLPDNLKEQISEKLFPPDSKIISDKSPMASKDIPIYSEITKKAQTCNFYCTKKNAKSLTTKLREKLGKELMVQADWQV